MTKVSSGKTRGSHHRRKKRKKQKKINFIIAGFITTLLSQDVFEGYTLFTPGGGGSASTRLLDTNNQTFHTWSHSTGPASMPYLIPGDEPGFENTLLYYPCTVHNPTMENGGVGGAVEIYDWDGNSMNINEELRIHSSYAYTARFIDNIYFVATKNGLEIYNIEE